MIPKLTATVGFNTQKQVKKHKKLYEPKNNAYDDPKGAHECKEIQWGDNKCQNLRNSRGATFLRPPPVGFRKIHFGVQLMSS